MNRQNILISVILLLILAIMSLFLIASHIISVPGITESKVASHFLNLYNLSDGEETLIFGENITREELTNNGYEIIKINDTYIKEIPVLSRAFEKGSLAMIYNEDRDSAFPLQNKVLEYNGSLYHVMIGFN